MYYPCSENKDADQLRGYREADLRLCFRPCKLLVFSRTGSNCLFAKGNICSIDFAVFLSLICHTNEHLANGSVPYTLNSDAN